MTEETEEIIQNERVEVDETNSKEINENKKIKKESKIDKVKKELESLKEEVQIQSDKAIRASAELVNYKKRKDDEVAKSFKYANSTILLNLLNVVDNFESAMKMEDNDKEANTKFLEGFKLIYNQLLEILNNNEVIEIETIGKIFDPTFHQAVMSKENIDLENDIVLEVFQKGYMYKDRLLRPSMVVVNNLQTKGKEENE